MAFFFSYFTYGTIVLFCSKPAKFNQSERLLTFFFFPLFSHSSFLSVDCQLQILFYQLFDRFARRVIFRRKLFSAGRVRNLRHDEARANRKRVRRYPTISVRSGKFNCCSRNTANKLIELLRRAIGEFIF